jgi:hypothetical protein
VLGCAANQQEYSPEMTGFPVRTERHCCGMVEGLAPSWILPRRLNRQCGASVVTARDAVIIERRSNDVTEQTYRHAEDQVDVQNVMHNGPVRVGWVRVGGGGMDSNHRLVLFTHALCRLSYPAARNIDRASI